jgi:tetratricopeptide (TPR) repeat protein
LEFTLRRVSLQRGKLKLELQRAKSRVEARAFPVQYARVSRKTKRPVPAPQKRARQVWPFILVGGVGVAAILFANKNGFFPRSRPGPGTVATNATAARTVSTNFQAEFLAWISSQTNAVDLLNTGTELLEQGRLPEAILCYQRTVELKPEDEEARFNLGVACGRAGRLEEAGQHYHAALKLFPEYIEAHNNLGNLLTRQKRYAEAEAEFKIALELAPENASAHNNLGRALAEQGQAAAALEHFAAAARFDTNYVEAYFNLGSSYMNAGQTNAALVQFNTVLRLRPGFAPALQMISRLQPSGNRSR